MPQRPRRQFQTRAYQGYLDRGLIDLYASPPFIPSPPAPCTSVVPRAPGAVVASAAAAAAEEAQPAPVERKPRVLSGSTATTGSGWEKARSAELAALMQGRAFLHSPSTPASPRRKPRR
jgi:hypothetical protein